jgi:O-antigen/teichoic acid export membrane protein
MRIPLLERFDAHLLEVVRGASVALFVKAAGTITVFGFNLLLARMLGPEGAGTFFLALTVTTIATVVGRFGLDNTLLRFIAGNAAVGDWKSVKGVYVKGMFLALGISAVSALTMFLLVPWLADAVFRKPELTHPMRWMSLAVIPLSLQILHAEALKALKHIFSSALLDLHGVALGSTALLLALTLTPVWGSTGAVWAYDFAAGFSATAGLVLWRLATPQLENVRGEFRLSVLLQTSLPLFWVSSLGLAMNWTASIALGIWSTSADVGIFNVASRTAVLTSSLLLAVNSISAPKFAALYRQGDTQALGDLARNSVKLTILASLPIFLTFILFPHWIMGLFGPAFAQNSAVLVILAIGQIVNTCSGPVSILLTMSGEERLVMTIAAFVAILNILLNLALVPSYGIIGAGFATAISLSAQNLIAAYLVYRHLGICTIPIGRAFKNG